MAGGDAVPRIALAVPDVVRQLAKLGDAVDHDAHGAAPLVLDVHTLELWKCTFDTGAQFAGNVA
ncbi:hypothetical protein D3C81_1401820 [compost metagenome]